MYCKKCGTKIDDDSIFCFMCGVKVESEPETPKIESKSKINTFKKENTQNVKYNDKDDDNIIFPIIFLLLTISSVFAIILILALNMN